MKKIMLALFVMTSLLSCMTTGYMGDTESFLEYDTFEIIKENIVGGLIETSIENELIENDPREYLLEYQYIFNKNGELSMINDSGITSGTWQIYQAKKGDYYYESIIVLTIYESSLRTKTIFLEMSGSGTGIILASIEGLEIKFYRATN